METHCTVRFCIRFLAASDYPIRFPSARSGGRKVKNVVRNPLRPEVTRAKKKE